MKNKFVVGGFLILVLTIAGLVMNLVYSSGFIRQYLRVSQLKKAYLAESVSIPELGTPEFQAYGGDLLVKVQVAEKGTVTFWYDPVFVPRFTVINGQSVEYQCSPSDGSPSFVMALQVISSSIFIKDFGFEIRTLADIVLHFDDLVAKVEAVRKSSSYQEPVYLELTETKSLAACFPVQGS